MLARHHKILTSEAIKMSLYKKKSTKKTKIITDILKKFDTLKLSITKDTNIVNKDPKRIAKVLGTFD